MWRGRRPPRRRPALSASTVRPAQPSASCAPTARTGRRPTLRPAPAPRSVPAGTHALLALCPPTPPQQCVPWAHSHPPGLGSATGARVGSMVRTLAWPTPPALGRVSQLPGGTAPWAAPAPAVRRAPPAPTATPPATSPPAASATPSARTPVRGPQPRPTAPPAPLRAPAVMSPSACLLAGT